MTINQYSSPVQNTLESYIPLPLDTLMKAGQAIQQRGDLTSQQNDNFQTGLASMEALAPSHRQYVNTAVNNYKDQQAKLLDKYNGNTSDPNYERESRRVNMQFAADPNLKIIQNTNDLYKAKQKIKDTLDAQGVKYLDSNPTFTGLDSNGNLSNNVGQLRATAFDTNIDKSFKDLENATEQIGHTITNRGNLAKHQTNLLSDLASGTNPDIQDALHYYKQQGLNDTAAKMAVISHINDGMKYAHDLKDHFYDISPYQAWEMKYKEQELAAKAAKVKAGPTPVLPADIFSNTSPILSENLGKDKISSVDRVLNNLNPAGGLQKGNFTIDDTPENRKKYPNAIQNAEGNSTGLDPAIGGGSGTLKVPTDKYNPDESRLLDEARDILKDKAKNKTGGWLSDKHVLSMYQDVLKNNQANAYNYHIPGNEKFDNALTSQYFGKNMEKLGNDYLVITDKGKFKAGSKEAEEALANVKHLSTMGTNPAPLGDYTNGTVAASGTMEGKDASGKVIPRSSVIVIKPMDQTTASSYRFSNLAARALASPYGNKELATSSETKSLRIQNPSTGQWFVPQKGLDNLGKISVKYIPVDSKGDIIPNAKALDISSIEAGEHSNFYTKLGQSIFTKPQDQNYRDNQDNED